jgi:methylated-DNA-[protein]-cysteine S-methyltransferase
VAERTIPRGYVSSYSALAAHIGKPKAARAAGTALARNPFPIIIPCHRTVRTDGSLGGFGGGLPMKRALLEMEGVAFDGLGHVKKEFFWDLSTGSTT